MLALLREGLLAIEALPRATATATSPTGAALVQRTDLTPKELRLLEHVARKMGRRGGRSASGRPAGALRRRRARRGRLLDPGAEVAGAPLHRGASPRGRRLRARPRRGPCRPSACEGLFPEGVRFRVETVRRAGCGSSPIYNLLNGRSFRQRRPPHPLAARAQPLAQEHRPRRPQGPLPAEEQRLRGVPGGRRRARPAARAAAEGLRHRHDRPPAAGARSSSATASSSAAASGSPTCASAGR